MQRDVTLIFDRDHNLIILFLILLRIWSIDVDVKYGAIYEMRDMCDMREMRVTCNMK